MDKLDSMVANDDGPQTLSVLSSSHSRLDRNVNDIPHATVDFLIPLSPALPLLSPLFVSFLRSITTAEYLHQPYFETKGMSPDEIWRWVEERKWAYRGTCLSSPSPPFIYVLIWTFIPVFSWVDWGGAHPTAFGFAASLVESVPIAGLFFSIPNRIGAAMM